MTNTNLGTLDAWVVAANATLAAASFGWNAVAAIRIHEHEHAYRVLHIVVMILAAIYAAAYGVLLLVDVQVSSWSALMRGVSLTVWPVVWIGPAMLHARRTATRVATRALVSEIERQLGVTPESEPKPGTP